MLKKLFLSFFLLISVVFAQTLSSEEHKFVDYLLHLPDCYIQKVQGDSFFQWTYEVKLKQPLDHDHPDNGSFYQRIRISHKGYDRPTIIVTEGYNLYYKNAFELAKILDANQIVVEHRYFDQSRPEKMDWTFLTIDQAVQDYHRIRTLLDSLYSGKWISTGVSKGGQTALYYRWKFPEDVVGTVAYVAPVNLSQEDPRIDEFIRNLISRCPQKVEKFQLAVLEHPDSMAAYLTQYARDKKISFRRVGIHRTIEYMVLEYPFSFWQWGKGKCDDIPDEKSTPRELFNHLIKYSSPYYYDDRSVKEMEPAYYMFFTQLGYYGFKYNSPDVLEHLSYLRCPTNSEFAPVGVPLPLDSRNLKRWKTWLEHKAKNIIYIYGENDPWSATAVDVSKNKNC
ncbi:MAG: hypothetical protein D6732_21015, partial [Methanobacteriota archaeon]